MGNNKRNNQGLNFNYNPHPRVKQPTPQVTATSLLDHMVEGKEYESIIGLNNVEVNLGEELVKSINEISIIRKRPVICYVANIINQSIKSSVSIDPSDDRPFNEMLGLIPYDDKDLDIILVTPGGSAEIVANYVNNIRRRFDKVGFILPYMAMSAGAIFCLSGDELIMDENAFIGPIDPQVPSKDGRYVPAQSISTLVNDIQKRGQEQITKGEQPSWTDIQILRNLDPKELGNTINASQFSINLVSQYLENYKFKTWVSHKDGSEVTALEKKNRANEIANILCNHSLWLSHSRRISREMLHSQCQLNVIHPESVVGLDRAIKRFWALMTFTLERTSTSKIFASNKYFIMRAEQIAESR